jgi:hypothetical protein
MPLPSLGKLADFFTKGELTLEGLTVRILNNGETGQSGAIYRSNDAEPATLELLPLDTGVGGAQYDLLLDLPGGSSHAWPARHLFVVGINLDPGHEEDFEAWYNNEHLPALVAVPGVSRAVRFKRVQPDPGTRDQYPAYLALYDIENPGIAGNEDWQAAVNTPWTIRLRPHFQALWRGGYQLQAIDS